LADFRHSQQQKGRAMFDLTGKVAVITASTRGIGRAIAEAFIAAGATVVVSGKSAQSTAKAAAELNTFGIACDVAEEASLAALLDGTIARFGGIDILVCNAGITGQTGTSTLDDFDQVMTVNMRIWPSATAMWSLWPASPACAAMPRSTPMPIPRPASCN